MFLFVLAKLKEFLLLFISIFRRAFCCFRRRRRLSKDEPLSHIVVNEGGKQSLVEQEQWNDWEFKNRKPASVEEHIEYYRQQQAKLRTQSSEEPGPEELDHFQDMIPEITKQKKIIIGQDKSKVQDRNALNMQVNCSIGYSRNELENWEDNCGWESQALESDTSEILRQKKREERKRRQLEQQQRRMERIASSPPNLGSRLMT